MDTNQAFRQIVTRLRAQGLTYAQIAAELDVTVQKVSYHLRRAGLTRKTGKQGCDPRQYEYQGKFYTVRELAILGGVERETMYRRLKLWPSVADAVEGRRPKRISPKRRRKDGNSCPLSQQMVARLYESGHSLREIANELGVSHQFVHQLVAKTDSGNAQTMLQ